MVLQSLAGLPAFLVYFCTAIVAVVAYLFVYTRVTAHNEFDLIRANEPAAAIALGLSLLGFVLPLVSAIAHSANVWDCMIWAAIALIVQITVYFLVRVPVPKLSTRIAAGELAAAIWLGLASLAAGAINAACMIYCPWPTIQSTNSASANRFRCRHRRVPLSRRRNVRATLRCC
jgi:putative membrane protein